jgi:transposase
MPDQAVSAGRRAGACGRVRGRAGPLLSSAGDNPDRLRSEAAFAHLCGVAPIPASSGKTRRHRLNRGGDRGANNALYTVVLTRLRCDPRARRYVERRTAEGLSKPEIVRCLKRYLAREICQVLVTASRVLVVPAASSTAAGGSTLKRRRRAQRG